MAFKRATSCPAGSGVGVGYSNLSSSVSSYSGSLSSFSALNEEDEEPVKLFVRELELSAIESDQPSEEINGVTLQWVEDRIHVVTVKARSRAERAGLFVGDEILEVNGVTIDVGYPPEAVANLLAASGSVKITIRDGPTQSLTIERGHEKERIGISYDGGVVTNTAPDSPATRHRVPKGLGIVEVNGKSVMGKSDKDIMRRLDKTKGTLSLTLMDGALSSEINRSMSPRSKDIRRVGTPPAILSRSFEALRRFN